ncbi:MAG: hypothetical protein A3H50_00540 [Candidatus Levybacteria bacterium RIFCSPLOWO2_02_FULL_37_10]|uniref:DUF2878 domain-containing protein n=1 Tax=candidate division WWE3 bacterium RIFCSPLOWO2_12_FULL_36_10 TaxID=1802630 RepID=A0A1F4VG17_UNCKA|nr:MAG: hypothetical protein A3H26_01505 [candidate division WWE3 bacterium RIFCSPLOWO2_12_FULL_36_10]OGH44168.1 MAG: hypothetical protein A3H50_00540 [Candidatus Levybacteria bacterium RIFCSPLOWO2_02_FULL_37_10]
MNKKKLMVSVSIILLAIFVVFFFWRIPYLLITLLIVLAFIKAKLSPIRREIFMFVLIGFIGAGAESVLMFGGPWSYATPELINFPIWLPFLWGLAGVTGITLYQGISEN